MLYVGINQSSYTTLPNPNQDPFDINFEYIVVEKTSIQNDKNITYTGKEKRKVKLEYSFRTLAEFNSIKNYCNIPQPFWVKIETSSGIYYEYYSYLSIKATNVLAVSSDFRYSFEIIISQI